MIEIRPIEPSELRAWIEAMQIVYFGTRSIDEDVEYRSRVIDYSRSLGAFDGDRIAATFRSYTTELTVPGGRCIPVDAVTNVGVLPTHRRRGILTEMMRRDLRAAADRGDIASILFASEASIYGRYGYGVATEHAQLLIRRAHVRFRRPPEGDVEFVTWQQLREIAPRIYERFRLAQPGSIGLKDRFWDATLGIGPSPFGPKPGDRAVIARDAAGEPQGWLRYRGEETWTEVRPQGPLQVHELVAATPEAYARLWRFTTEVDLIGEIRAEQRPIVEPLPWLLTDRRVVHQSARHDGLWVRPLDPVAVLEARAYESPGELVLEITDTGGFAGGRFRLEAGPDGAAAVAPTDADADLALTVEALGAIYLGGTKLSVLARAGLIEELRPDTLRRAEAMFASPIVPWCWTEF